MKKLIILLLATTVGPIAFAQDSLSSYKPVAKSKNLELQFTPFGSPVIQINGIRWRSFKTSRQALRFNLFVGYSNSSVITQQPSGTTPKLKNISSTFSVNFRPGSEFHKKGNSKLSPYMGYEFDFAVQITQSTSQAGITSSTITKISRINETGFWRIGYNLIAGFDFYIAKGLYLGSELGYGISFTQGLPTTVKSDADDFNAPGPVKKGGSFNIGPNVNTSIRLGYIFSGNKK